MSHNADTFPAMTTPKTNQPGRPAPGAGEAWAWDYDRRLGSERTGPAGDLGGGHPGVEPQGDRRVPQVSCAGGMPSSARNSATSSGAMHSSWMNPRVCR